MMTYTCELSMWIVLSELMRGSESRSPYWLSIHYSTADDKAGGSMG